ncbi:MAG: 16S rRNA (adenine(1518)-N(6)/adenine(1519)-N(6))-dimethyltransferase RsmA [Nitratireductor sp.]
MAKKALGQNFLLDLNLTARIARQAGPLEGHDVVEVGPGPGGLTRALLAEGARRVIAVEKDPRCLPALAEIADRYPGRLKIVEGDALETGLADMVRSPARIIANLPYNVATPLLTGWLLTEPWPAWFSSMTLMFQREVAERICAAPGSKSYGRLSVLSQWRCEAEIAFDVGPKAFTPPPKVTSSVAVLYPRGNPLPCPADALQRVTAAAFGQRRKMLRQSLKSLGGADLLERAGIEPERRAETLDIAEFVALANALSG